MTSRCNYCIKRFLPPIIAPLAPIQEICPTQSQDPFRSLSLNLLYRCAERSPLEIGLEQILYPPCDGLKWAGGIVVSKPVDRDCRVALGEWRMGKCHDRSADVAIKTRIDGSPGGEIRLGWGIEVWELGRFID